MKTTYYSRAWTFQEYLFSKRRVVFQSDTVNWECLCSAWHESQDPSNTSKISISHLANEPPLTGFKTTPWPDMFRYARLVSLFNQRNLTYPEDVLEAFAGIFSHLSRNFPGGFLSGLPVMCFDAALLWQPYTSMTRRRSAKRSALDAVLPSWSWAGWAGDMNSESWRSAAWYLYESNELDETQSPTQCSWETKSSVTWSYSLTLTSPHKLIKMPIQFDRTTSSLPPSWVAKASLDRAETLFYHACDPAQPFRCPIPIRDQHVAHMPPISARYLHCHTSRAFLAAGSIHHSSASLCLAMELLTPGTKQWAGVLRLAYEIEDMDPNASLELIEISAGSVTQHGIEEKSFDEWKRDGVTWLNGVYEFVNVLWIERKEDVAYRKAVGRVAKQVWESLEKETIAVVLG